ncbi:hypothetical protein ILUMI_23657 [Ignelater luminosus]|uniref:Mutator-like transposase domain-containing protein n=1 Tax=Ignelater luminosus TaxID=2038154 RepID=A0A8K0CC14_IGNLU|nr:hypothetical protein ILUMI_23657 [Ignelater luminosus]
MGNKQNERNSSSNRSKHPKKTKRARCALARYKKIRETGQPIQCQPNVIEAEPSAVVVDPPTSTEPEIVNDLFDTDTCTSSESHFKSAEDCMKCPTWCIRTYNKPQKQPKQQLLPVGVISSDEYDDSLCIEKEEAPLPIIQGNRIVELGYIIDRVLHLQYEHTKICTLGKLFVEDETRKNLGLISSINLKCNMCANKYVVFTEDPKKGISLINTGVVWGTLATGSTHSHLSELLSCMDVPQMPASMFNKLEAKLGEEWKNSLWRSMEAAGVKEKENAIEMNNVYEDGTPWITVYLDGSWSKRSYGHNYDAPSGMNGLYHVFGDHTACREGICNSVGDTTRFNTGKRLNIVQRGSYERRVHISGLRHNHKFQWHYSPWKKVTGQSPGKYFKKFMTSSTQKDEKAKARIRLLFDKETPPPKKPKLKRTNNEPCKEKYIDYGPDATEPDEDDVVIQQEVDRIVKNPQTITLSSHPKEAKVNFEFVWGSTAIGIGKGQAEELFSVIDMSTPSPKFYRKLENDVGSHSKCKGEYCRRRKMEEENLIPLLESSSILDEIKKIVDDVVRKASRLTQNVTTNHAERYEVDKQEDNDYGPNAAKEDLTNDEFATRKEEILRQLASDD